MRTAPLWLLVLLWTAVVLALGWVAGFPLVPVSSLLVRQADGDLLELIRSHRTTVPFHLAWSSEGWRWVGWSGRLLPAVLVLCAAVVGWRRRWVESPQATASARLRLATGLLVVAATTVAFWFGRVPIAVLITYGDSIKLIQQIAQASWVFPAEPLMMHLFNVVSRLLTWWRGAPDGILAGQLTAVACGAIAMAALWNLAASRRRDISGTLVLFLALAGTGTTTQFFGVIETTLLQTAAIACFLTACVRVLQSAVGSPSRDRWLLVSHLCMGILLSAHAAGVALLPSLVTLWVFAWRQEKQHDGERSHRLLSWRNTIGALLGCLAPWLVFVWWPFTRVGNFGNGAGGADTFRFVPWNVETARESSSYVYYDMVSRLHLLDVGAAVLAACPFALLLLFAAVVLRRSTDGHRMRTNDATHVVSLVAAVGCGAVVLLWDFDFGMWGDWNIVTCYLLPLHVASWLVFDDALRRTTPTGPGRWLLCVPLLVAQVALGLGLWLQLHPPGVP